MSRDIEVVKQAIAAGEDLNAKNDVSETLFDASNDGGHPGIVEILVQHCAIPSDQ